MPLPALTDRKVAFIREFVHETIVQLSDYVYDDPDPVDPRKYMLLDMIDECRRRARLMSSYAITMEHFMDEASGRTPSFIYDSFADTVHSIYKSIEDLLVSHAWGRDDEVDDEFNEFLFELGQAYFTVQCATTRINLSFC